MWLKLTSLYWQSVKGLFTALNLINAYNVLLSFAYTHIHSRWPNLTSASRFRLKVDQILSYPYFCVVEIYTCSHNCPINTYANTSTSKVCALKNKKTILLVVNVPSSAHTLRVRQKKIPSNGFCKGDKRPSETRLTVAKNLPANGDCATIGGRKNNNRNGIKGEKSDREQKKTVVHPKLRVRWNRTAKWYSFSYREKPRRMSRKILIESIELRTNEINIMFECICLGKKQEVDNNLMAVLNQCSTNARFGRKNAKLM